MAEENEAGRAILECLGSEKPRENFGDGKEGCCSGGAEQPFSRLQWRNSDERLAGSNHRDLFTHLALNQKLCKQVIHHGMGGTQKLLPGTQQVGRRKY